MKTQQNTKLHHPGLWKAAPTDIKFEPEAHTESTESDALSPAVQNALQQKPSEWVTVIGGDKNVIAELIESGVAEHQIRWLQ